MKKGSLMPGQRDLIHRVFDLADTSVEDIMTPRVDMFCLPVSTSPQALRREIIEQGYSRVPLYGTGPDDIVGILYARDLLGLMAEGKAPASAEPLLRKPYFVPEERSADQVLRDFQKRNMHVALVVDEYGGISGLVTMEDILEALFGDIYDERDTRERPFHRIDERTLMVSGSPFHRRFQRNCRHLHSRRMISGPSAAMSSISSAGCPSRGDEIFLRGAHPRRPQGQGDANPECPGDKREGAGS